MKLFRTILGVGIIGPIVGISRFILNSTGLILGCAAFLTSLVFGYSLPGAVVMAAGCHILSSIAHFAISLLDAYRYFNSIPQERTFYVPFVASKDILDLDYIDNVAKRAKHPLSTNPVGSAIITGFSAANAVAKHAVYDFKSYGIAHKANGTLPLSF